MLLTVMWPNSTLKTHCFCFCWNSGYMNTKQCYLIYTLPILFRHYHTQKNNTRLQTKFRNLVILNKLYCLVKQKLYRLEYSILFLGFHIQVLQFMKSGKFSRVIFKTNIWNLLSTGNPSITLKFL